MEAEPAGTAGQTTSAQAPATTGAGGLPAAEDKVVRELDVYLCNRELGQDTQTYLLQFPLRPLWRPYHEDHVPLQDVKLKAKVKKLQCDVPLDPGSRNYNDNVEPSRRITSATLHSSRLDMRASFAAGFVEEDRLLLFPVDEALQLRPSLSYLDKEKEGAGGKKKGQQDAAGEGEDQKPPELMQLTVQYKRRETEQQQEARLRSYAHLAATEEADPWVPLEFHGESSELAQTLWQKLATVDDTPDVAHTLSREQYLQAVVPGSSTFQSYESANWAAGAMSARDLGRPAPSGQAAAATAQQAQQEGPIPGEVQSLMIAATLILLKSAAVVNLDQIRTVLTHHTDGAVKALAGQASDAALHQAVIASGEVTHLRKSYFATRLGNTALDPLRTVLIELLKEQDQLKRSDILEAAKARNISVSDSLYSKVVKELCSSRGSIWSLKT